MARHWTSRSMIAAGMFATVAAASACTPKVTRDEFNSEVAKIREEMQTGDQQLGTRVDSLDGRVNALEQELAAFKSEYNVSIEKMKGAMKFNVPVHFDFNESALREADRPVLDRFANVVQEYYPNAVVTVEGFADPAGSRAYNEQLGMLMGTGPYKMKDPESWRPGQKIIVYRNDLYWGEPAPFDRIIYNEVTEEVAWLTMFRNGEIDRIPATPDQPRSVLCAVPDI